MIDLERPTSQGKAISEESTGQRILSIAAQPCASAAGLSTDSANGRLTPAVSCLFVRQSAPMEQIETSAAGLNLIHH